MNPLFESMSAAASGLHAQGFRIRIVSENIANADTPGYHRKTLAFDNVFDAKAGAERVTVDRIELDGSPLEEKYDPAHPLADENGYVALSNVNLMVEMADAREASRSYEANLAAFRQAREMYSSLLDLLKR
ncbi:flagellar basal body rod protein FlgC [Amphiplicatus metriothermophilus]|uniref:Flagellar basal-body rod protein FlgC n=1 Tax=Amphiplicatus metriothermophilus TaxID=1519374 RepID=A0A239PLV1_9PROT|nr:flagellar basal body rod protein FlgC [Amphiplicatus metriothermophilus]MBB5517331.1 flagellar basal-body rod protein FlgC [Amphiplicatus metriothermophilus]SNT68333.1 flagellar basal-body rod protein FlgC [Amphiplicatus metriothermophilus]